MTARHLMKCGHVAQGMTLGPDRRPMPVCVACVGIHAGAMEVDADPPELTGREATCICGARQPSSYSLAFFAHHPLLPTDAFYDGCKGWS